MQRKKPDVDIINDVLKAAVLAYPQSVFIQSLALQYQQRGGLSKKQMEGLYLKAEKIETLPKKWLATMEAEILKKPTRYKSVAPALKPLYEKDENTGKMIETILEKYPQHKRVIFFQSKYNNNEPLTSNELTELEKFHRFLMTK